MEILSACCGVLFHLEKSGSLVSVGQYESSLLNNQDLMRKKACHRLNRIHYI